MSTQQKPTITIIGAGLAGCYFAILLAKRGYQVDIYERLSEDKITEDHSKRTFNLTFYHRCVLAIKKADLWDEVKKILVPLEGSVYHPDYTDPIFTPFDYKGKPQYTVQRPDLLHIFIKQAAVYPTIRFHFNTSLITVNRWKKTMLIQDTTTKECKELKCDVIFGADGVNSAIRSFIQAGQTATHIQENLTWKYKEVTITKKMGEEMGWRKRASHIISRKNALFVAFPNNDESFTMMIILPEAGATGFNTLREKSAIMKFLGKEFKSMSPAHEAITQSILENPLGYFSTVYTSPWYYENFMAIIGDAAHAVLPFYGQGMASAFEDGLELVQLMEVYEGNWEKIFMLYQEKRKESTDVLADLSKENFIKFQRHTFADYAVILDRLDSILHSLFPKFWLPPLYVMVYNETIPFAEILKKHHKRRRIAGYLGITIAARLLYGILLLKEKLLK